MAQISLNSVTVAFGGPLILDRISLDIQKGQKICILGRNGVGKSTLMKLISGDLIPDSGNLVLNPGLKIAYLSQNVPEQSDETVFSMVASGAGLVGEQLVEWHQLAAQNIHNERFTLLQHSLDENGGWEIENDTKRAIQITNLNENDQLLSLSGGTRRRVMLARALVKNPDILLLDEPTNHLDLESIEWLEEFMVNSKITILFVTHDRKLLKKAATRIIELDRGKLYDWSCDYDTFLKRKESFLDAEEKEWELFDKKLAQEEVWIRKGIKARRTRNEGRVRALKKMREERRKRRERTGTVKMAISESSRSGDKVIDIKSICFSFDNKQIIKDCSFTLERGDRVGILGPNGCGKSTLLNLILGKLQPDCGAIETGTSLIPVYFDQLRDILDTEKSVWENLVPGRGDTVFVNGEPRHVVSYLQDFLFSTERIHSPVKQLSGGERNRLVLARLFTQPSNLLILDEPTNDLDTETLELLEEVLGDYQGTILVVSHDREFLNNIVTSVLVFTNDGTIRDFVGGYDDWVQMQMSIKSEPQKNVATEKKNVLSDSKPAGVRKLNNKERQLLESLPQLIESLEIEQGDLQMKMADPKYFQQPGFISETKQRLSTIENELLEAFDRWGELESRA
jgi:ATP-binding cassette subfamily F protein uup